jgi:hypothetical protein
MYLSEFVVVERAGTFVDPLGFMRPAGALQDTLFKQFTVLSNHPAYHGMLCVIWEFLREAGAAPGKPDFARKFREVEIFWGLLNAIQGNPILNVRKYTRLLAEGEFALGKVSRQHAIYARLGYGTLGHYTQPSILWGLVEPKGNALSEIGRKLAGAARWRSKLDLNSWLTRWANGESFQPAHLAEVQRAHHLLGEPADGERSSWQEVISQWTNRQPHTAPLWTDPVPFSELDAALASHGAYSAHHAALADRYPSLGSRIMALRDFERLTGAIQLVFDLKLAHLQFSQKLPVKFPAVLDELPAAVVDLARRASSTGRTFEPRALFSTLASTEPSYRAIEQVVSDHHIAHQRGKGVSPFFDQSGLLVKDKVSSAELGPLVETLADEQSVETCLDRLQYRSRRDWHFRRCRVYHDWAYGQGEQA